MSVKIETPPSFNGAQEQQMMQIYSYLFRLAENLNIALNNLNKDNFSSATEIVQEQQAGSLENGGSIDLSTSYNELRSLIVNTAQIIRSEMDKISTELSSQYSAVSDEWGVFQENISSTIEATANGVIQSYNYDSSIQALQEDSAGFSQYIISTEGYIRQGFIDKDENNVPILGIAIGQGLKSTTVKINGEEYEQLDESQSCAFYTSNKVSFRINGQEVAYVSNRKLYIGDVEITGAVILGGKWMVSTTNGLKIQWIGEVQ